MIMKGLIFDVQRFSLHDGPGIRTTVFLKGCNLRCLWCHNPESLYSYPEIEYYPNKCIGCGSCIEQCPHANQIIDGKIVYCRENCIHCGKCAQNCFAGARVLAGKSMDVTVLMDIIEQDVSFYSRAGGGVTFSGGEPLLQKDFLEASLRECKNRGLHTAIDTAGNVPWEDLESILPLTDLFLYDLKAMDPEVHKHATGVDNVRILDNLQRLSAQNTPIIIRIPVVSGINDSIENMERTAEYLGELKNINKVELLSFHLLGEGKYESLDKMYMAKDFKMLDKKELLLLQKPFTQRGIEVKVS